MKFHIKLLIFNLLYLGSSNGNFFIIFFAFSKTEIKTNYMKYLKPKISHVKFFLIALLTHASIHFLYSQDLDFYCENLNQDSLNSKQFFWRKNRQNANEFWGMEVKNANRVSFQADTAGNRYLQIDIKGKDAPGRIKYPRSRAEITYRPIHHQTLGKYYYSWRFMIPNDSSFRDTIPPKINGKDSWHFIAQWHDPVPKHTIDQDTFNSAVPIFFEYKHDTISKGPDRQLWIKFRSTKVEHGYQIFRASIQKGQWVEIVMHVNWALDDSGYLECWVNGNPIQEMKSGKTRIFGSNIKRLKNGEVGNNYFKAGHYRRGYTTNHTIYFDDFSFGKRMDQLIIQPN